MNPSRFSNPANIILTGFLTLLLVMTAVAGIHYPGEWYIYLIFSVASVWLLLAGFAKNAIFFDTFIGVFFWLGFWLKTTFKLIFADGVFKEAVGQFDGSGEAFDRALIVATIAFIGLLVARWIRLKWGFDYRQHHEAISDTGLFRSYKKYRKRIWLVFAISILMVGISNAYLGIYQRGEIPRAVLPFGLNGVYTWLLLFGLASFSALILRLELAFNPAKQYTVSIIALFEVFVSNVSLLSRGMLLNVFALFYGFYTLARCAKIKISASQTTVVLVLFVALFGLSIGAVNYLRYDKQAHQVARLAQAKAVQSGETTLDSNYDRIRQKVHKKLLVDMTGRLLIDRWVGMEGLLAISSYPKLGWGLFNEALREKYSNHETSFYDLNLINSPYARTNKTEQHYISLPGAVAFFFYPGSHLFVFAVMIMIGIFAAWIELCAYKLGGGNLILCALVSQVVAFRLASFGYVPSQSYLLIGTILVNLFLIYLLRLLLDKYFKSEITDRAY